MTEPPRKRRFPAVPAALVEYVGMLAALAGLIAVFSFSTERFFSAANFRLIANQNAYAIIIAVGMTFVLIIAGIDLSVGSVLALSGAILGVCIAQWRLPVLVGIAACLGVGLMCGLVNGFVSITWRLPSFIVTLGMLEIARGATYWVTGSETILISSSLEKVSEASVFGLSCPFLIAIAVVVVAQLVLSRTVFGRYMIAVGTNEEAVRLSGIDPRPIKLAVFVLCSLLTSVAAVLRTSRINCANPNDGTGFELQAIAAVVIGGTSLMGGRGSVVRSFFGVLIIAVLVNGLAQIGLGEHAKRLATGGAIVAAVILDYYRQRLRRPGGIAPSLTE